MRVTCKRFTGYFIFVFPICSYLFDRFYIYEYWVYIKPSTSPNGMVLGFHWFSDFFVVYNYKLEFIDLQMILLTTCLSFQVETFAVYQIKTYRSLDMHFTSKQSLLRLSTSSSLLRRNIHDEHVYCQRMSRFFQPIHAAKQSAVKDGDSVSRGFEVKHENLVFYGSLSLVVSHKHARVTICLWHVCFIRAWNYANYAWKYMRLMAQCPLRLL